MLKTTKHEGDTEISFSKAQQSISPICLIELVSREIKEFSLLTWSCLHMLSVDSLCITHAKMILWLKTMVYGIGLKKVKHCKVNPMMNDLFWTFESSVLFFFWLQTLHFYYIKAFPLLLFPHIFALDNVPVQDLSPAIVSVGFKSQGYSKESLGILT